MTDYELNQLENNLEDFLQKAGIDTSKKTMDCPICGDKGGFGFVPQSNRTYWHCFSAKHLNYARNSGNIFELVQQLENTDFKGALNILKGTYGISDSSYVPKAKLIQTKPEPIPEELDYQQFEANAINQIFEVAKNNIGNCDYLTNRGISVKTQQRYGIGVYANFIHPKTVWKHRNEPNWRGYTSPRMIIPTSPTTLLARAIRPQDEGENAQYKALKIGNTHVFNADILKQNVGYCYVFEGEIDALSAIECGYNAVGLGSTSMLDKLFKEYTINKDVVLIIAMDNDDGGRQAIPKAVELCKTHRQPHIVADSNQLFGGAKDCNQALQEDRIALTIALQKEFEKAKNLDIEAYRKECDAIMEQITKKAEETQSPPEVTLYDWDEIGRIDRAYDLAKGSVKYCKQASSWYHYDENLGILQRNLTDEFMDDLHRGIKSHMKQEMEVYKFTDRQKLLQGEKSKLEKEFSREMKSAITERALQNSLKGVARHGDTPIVLTDLDKSHLLNFRDLTLNLKTLKTFPHSIDNLCTKYVDADYTTPLDPQAVEDWNKFIDEIMCHDPEMVEFLQRVCGYILEVSNKEECFFILYGRTTRNGKSTLLNAISSVLNDYVKTVSSATLSERPTGKEANPEIINLIGAKLITCGELNAETLLNDTLLKAISGNDPQSARNLFSNDILTFKIDGKLFANCNELPPMKNDDLLNSKRVVVIPFDRHFEEHEQDKGLKERFSQPEYKAVIFQWIMEGYRRYLQLGIKAHMPKKVAKAMNEYQSESNSINAFLDDEDTFEKIERSNYEECVKVDNAGIKKLYPRYTEWCSENGCRPLSSLNFKKQLRKNRFYKKDCRQNTIRYWHCLCTYKLKPSFTYTDMSQPDNPDRLVTITQRQLDSLQKKQ